MFPVHRRPAVTKRRNGEKSGNQSPASRGATGGELWMATAAWRDNRGTGGAGGRLRSRLRMKCPTRVKQSLKNQLLAKSHHEFVSDGNGVKYSIPIGQCAPLLGACGGLDGTG